MSGEPTGPDAVPMTECRVCRTDVPAGRFCGLCGAFLVPHRGDGPDWLRLKVFGAAPDEHVLKPAVAGALFPHLPEQSRTPFRVGLVMVLAALVAAGLLRMPAALITVAALGLPLLFTVYLWESDGVRDLPGRMLGSAALLGAGLGVGWALLTGAAVARTYEVPLGAGIVGYRMLRDGVGVPLGAVTLMLAPAVVVRLLRPPSREALDGFMIGALGALCFTAAATVTRLAPQFAVGLVNRARPLSSLLVEAGIRGLAVPLTAAAVGGLIGAALWFTRPASKAGQHPGVVRAVLCGFAAAVFGLYLGVGLIETTRLPQFWLLTVHLAAALLALVLLRLGLQLALLHEAHDEIHAEEPLLCPHCGHVVPDMAFCPACGAATRASSRSSRAARRRNRPARIRPDGPS